MCIGHVMSLISFLSHIYFDRDCALHIRLQVQDNNVLWIFPTCSSVQPENQKIKMNILITSSSQFSSKKSL